MISEANAIQGGKILMKSKCLKETNLQMKASDHNLLSAKVQQPEKTPHKASKPFTKITDIQR
ncbi:CLUMA_CG006951, isoform A [Clunio marinus]|uniref:CLUMA_CG006951, isoform A n=1 Tax=Clunio marinus TaxID=568069 RepID=A0A1J1HZ81_9DIPT|nr:CLUMA_CG006951, isoform A [Clunio marinus]